MAPIEIRGVTIDPAKVRAVRPGNRLAPGLALFTGLSFLAYLAVKAATGQVAIDAALYVQVGVAAALLGVGGGLMARARYFFVVVETEGDRLRFDGLRKAEQREIVARLRAASAAADAP